MSLNKSLILLFVLVGVIGNHEELPKEVSARKLDGNEPPIVKGGISVPGAVEAQPPLTPEPPLSTMSPFLPTTDISGIQGKLFYFCVSSNVRLLFGQ